MYARRTDPLLLSFRDCGRDCGDIDLTVYLANVSEPVSLVLDLCLTHDRFRSTSDLNLNGHLHYPTDIDRSLNETVTDKIRKYRVLDHVRRD